MGIAVKLQVFEGPLDLLLHLIEKDKIDIYDIPIVEITKQYMDYIRAMKEKDLNVMSEFLVMAATLLSIKCKMLLPKEVGEDGEEQDPRQELVEQLLQYKMYKYISTELKDKQFAGERVIYRTSSIPKEVQEYSAPIDMDELMGDITLNKLNQIFKDVIRKKDDKIDPVRSKFGKIEKEEVKFTECLAYVESYVASHKQVYFRELLESQSSKVRLIVTFLAILELMKMGAISIEQEDTFGEIIITCRGESS